MLIIKALFEVYADYVLSIYLKLFKKNMRLISEDDFMKIKEIEQKAYPDAFREYAEYNNLNEFISGCGCSNIHQMYYLLEENWYFIAIRHFNYIEFRDFASSTGKCYEISYVIRWLFDNFKNKKIVMECRDATSYQLILAMQKRNRIKVLKDEPYINNMEIFHKIEIKSI